LENEQEEPQQTEALEKNEDTNTKTLSNVEVTNSLDTALTLKSADSPHSSFMQNTTLKTTKKSQS
jgi:hypothetical protein